METTTKPDIEKIYSHFARRLKAKKKELEVLKQNKFEAISQGDERAAYLEVVKKESEIYTIRQSIQFFETGSIELPEEKEARLKMEEKQRSKQAEQENQIIK